MYSWYEPHSPKASSEKELQLVLYWTISSNTMNVFSNSLCYQPVLYWTISSNTMNSILLCYQPVLYWTISSNTMNVFSISLCYQPVLYWTISSNTMNVFSISLCYQPVLYWTIISNTMNVFSEYPVNFLTPHLTFLLHGSMHRQIISHNVRGTVHAIGVCHMHGYYMCQVHP